MFNSILWKMFNNNYMQFVVKELKHGKSPVCVSTHYVWVCVHVQTSVEVWPTSDLHL